MSDLAIIEQPGSITPAKADKPPRISAKIKKAINLLVNGECKTQKAAAERVGCSDTYLSTQLNKPTTRAFYERKASENISRGIGRASARLVELMDAKSENVSAIVTMRVLEDRGLLQRQQGHSTSVSIVNNVAPGYVIDLTPSPADMTHTHEIEAKALTNKGDIPDGK